MWRLHREFQVPKQLEVLNLIRPIRGGRFSLHISLYDGEYTSILGTNEMFCDVSPSTSTNTFVGRWMSTNLPKTPCMKSFRMLVILRSLWWWWIKRRRGVGWLQQTICLTRGFRGLNPLNKYVWLDILLAELRKFTKFSNKKCFWLGTHFLLNHGDLGEDKAWLPEDDTRTRGGAIWISMLAHGSVLLVLQDDSWNPLRSEIYWIHLQSDCGIYLPMGVCFIAIEVQMVLLERFSTP